MNRIKMNGNNPKAQDKRRTGFAAQMRAWMRAQREPFTVPMLYEAMDAMLPKTRGVVRLTLRDFIRRAEVSVSNVEEQKRRQNTSLYVYQGRPANTPPAGKVRQRVYKAMRLISFREPFAIEDIRRMTGADRSYIDTLARRLLKDGHLRREGCRLRPGNRRTEAVYRVADTDRFRLEVMG